MRSKIIISSQFLPKRPTQTIFDLGPKERFNMIREVHHVHQKSWKKNSKKMAKRNHSKRSACSLAPSSRHYLPAYAKQEISQSIYNIIVPCIVFSCYIIPKIIQETFQYLHITKTLLQSNSWGMQPVLIRSLGCILWLFKNGKDRLRRVRFSTRLIHHEYDCIV